MAENFFLDAWVMFTVYICLHNIFYWLVKTHSCTVHLLHFCNLQGVPCERAVLGRSCCWCPMFAGNRRLLVSSKHKKPRFRRWTSMAVNMTSQLGVQIWHQKIGTAVVRPPSTSNSKRCSSCGSGLTSQPGTGNATFGLTGYQHRDI